MKQKNESRGYSEGCVGALDRTKIDWCSKSHSNASMIKEGVFPPGTSSADVRKLVDGSFGGRFEYFDEKRCEFKFIAYTD
ncbi:MULTISPECIES: hypothetical protein [unclassified Massilia]|uniref:hypothetical protein n=1 Tax=unclassified Massilia TaxID=2609279 RepID=UPI00068C0830|nr:MULTISPECIES: hypothetical protein [unclassified Massilia]AWG45804.1 hypothetical protein AM586_12795 [Massilia sp. WG5]